jgi:hypothetical protein
LYVTEAADAWGAGMGLCPSGVMAWVRVPFVCRKCLLEKWLPCPAVSAVWMLVIRVGYGGWSSDPRSLIPDI